MTTILTSAALGALVRETRRAARLTQTQLAERIGASRFWVTAFERGKPGAELGLALKAIQALGLAINISPTNASPADSAPDNTNAQKMQGVHQPAGKNITLDSVIAHATLSHVAPSNVVGWPGAKTGRMQTPKTPRRKP